MPFLRAALIRKNLQPEAERVEAVLTPVAEETQEPEEEFTPTQIDDLHRIIDARTKEAERTEEIIVVEPVQETTEESEHAEPESEYEAVIESAPEIAESQTESAHETSQPESLQEVLPESEQQHEAVTESIAPEAEQETEIITETLTPDSEQQQEVTTESVAPESEQQQEDITETITPEAENETVTPEPEAQEPEISESESEPEAVILPEDSNTASTDFDENLLLNESAQNETPENVTETHESEPENESESEQDDSQPVKPHKDYSGSQLNYDFTSGERYVDKVSTKTEFDKMLDELANISKELLSWQTDKFARDFTGKFSEGESSQAEARKYEAFLGGYITNAAMILYDKGYRDAALKQLEQAKSILDARKKLEDETSAIKSRVEEQNDSVDLSDILGLFGDG